MGLSPELGCPFVCHDVMSDFLPEGLSLQSVDVRDSVQASVQFLCLAPGPCSRLL